MPCSSCLLSLTFSSFLACHLQRSALFSLNAFCQSSLPKVVARAKACFRKSVEAIREEKLSDEHIDMLSKSMAHAETNEKEGFMGGLFADNAMALEVVVLVTPVLGFCVLNIFLKTGTLIGIVAHLLLFALLIYIIKKYREHHKTKCQECYLYFEGVWGKSSNDVSKRFKRELQGECQKLRKLANERQSTKTSTAAVKRVEVPRGKTPHFAEVINEDWAIPVDQELSENDNNIIVEPLLNHDLPEQNMAPSSESSIPELQNGTNPEDTAPSGAAASGQLDSIQENTNEDQNPYVLPRLERLDQLLDIEKLSKFNEAQTLSAEDLQQLASRVQGKEGQEEHRQGLIPEDLVSTLTKLASKLKENGSMEFGNEVEQYLEFAKSLDQGASGSTEEKD